MCVEFYSILGTKILEVPKDEWVRLGKFCPQGLTADDGKELF